MTSVTPRITADARRRASVAGQDPRTLRVGFADLPAVGGVVIATAQ